ncbi:hypothetical protein FOL46_003930, partial [Perkinsus olseni]
SIPSDTTISRKCKEVAAERRELVKNKIKAQRPPYQVHFDAWLNPYQNRHLLGITVNLHNGDHSRPALLALQELPSETAADVLATTNDVLSKYELDGKSILFSTDSASNNIAALNEGDLASTPCFAHLIQLAIKCGTCPKQEESTRKLHHLFPDEMLAARKVEKDNSAAALVAATARMVLYIKKSRLNSKIKDKGYNKLKP